MRREPHTTTCFFCLEKKGKRGEKDLPRWLVNKLFHQKKFLILSWVGGGVLCFSEVYMYLTREKKAGGGGMGETQRKRRGKEKNRKEKKRKKKKRKKERNTCFVL